MQTMMNRRFGLGLLLAVPLLIALLLPAARPISAAEPWKPVKLLSVSTENSFFPDVAYDSTGSVHTVWASTVDFKSRRVYYKKRTGNATTGVWDATKKTLTTRAAAPLFYADRPRIYTATINGQVKVGIVLKGDGVSSSPLNSGIYYLESLDGGTTWSLPKQVSGEGANEPDLVLDNQGNPHIVYSRLVSGVLHIYYTGFVNGAWTPAKWIDRNVTTNTAINTKYNNYATIEYTGSVEAGLNLHVLFMGEENPGGELLKGIFYARAMAGVWATPKRIATNSADQPDIESNHVNSWYATYHSYTDAMAWEPYVATSTNNGRTWTTAVVGFKNAEWGVRPGIGRSASGDLAVVFDSNADSANLNVASSYKPTTALGWRPAGWVAIQPGLAKEAEVAGGVAEFGAVWHEIPNGSVMNIFYSYRSASAVQATATSTSTATSTAEATATETATSTQEPTATTTRTRTATLPPAATATETTVPTETQTPTASPTSEPGAISAAPEIAGGAARTNNVSDLSVSFTNVQGDPTELRYAWETPPSADSWEAFTNPFTLGSYPSGLTTGSCPTKTLFTQVRAGDNTQASASSDAIIFDTGVQSTVTVLNPLGQGAPTTPGGGNFSSYPAGAGTADYLRGLQYVYRVSQETAGCAGVQSFDTLNNIEPVRGSADLNKNFWVTFSPELMGLTQESSGNYNEQDIVASIRVTDTLGNAQVFTKTMHFDDDAPTFNVGASTISVGNQTGENDTATVNINASVADSSYGSQPGIAADKAYWGLWVLIINDSTWSDYGFPNQDNPPTPSTFYSLGSRVIPLAQGVTSFQLNLTDSSSSANGIASGSRYIFIRALDGAGNFSNEVYYTTATVNP